MSKDTLQLPKTDFSMKASLSTKEPQILEKWEKNKIFEKDKKKLKRKRKIYFARRPSICQWPYSHGNCT